MEGRIVVFCHSPYCVVPELGFWLFNIGWSRDPPCAKTNKEPLGALGQHSYKLYMNQVAVALDPSLGLAWLYHLLYL